MQLFTRFNTHVIFSYRPLLLVGHLGMLEIVRWASYWAAVEWAWP